MYRSGMITDLTVDRDSNGFPGLNSRVLDMKSSSTLQQTVPVAGTAQLNLQWDIRPVFLPELITGRLPTFCQGPSVSSVSSTAWRTSVIDDARGTDSKLRRKHEEQVSQEEMEKKKRRRERNRLAAARCRSRRQEIVETLENEVDQLENEKAHLQDVIAGLESLKDKLELILEAHQPMCKMSVPSSIPSDSRGTTESMKVKSEPVNHDPSGCSFSTSGTWPEKLKTKTVPILTCLPGSSPGTPAPLLTPKSESLLMPVPLFSPFFTPCSTRMSFTFPSSPLNFKDTVTAPLDTSPQTCGYAYRRGSNSADQWSDYPLNSPTLLSL